MRLKFLSLSLIILFLIAISILAEGQSKITNGKATNAQISFFLADFVTDTFTEGSDILLGAHTGEVGATWTVHTSYGSDAATIDSASDRVYPTADPKSYWASGTPPSADYTVCADIFAASNITANIGPAGRIDTTANTMYSARYNSGTTWELAKRVTGSNTILGSSTNQLISIGNSKTVCLVMSGTSISLTVDGTTEVGPVTDSAITAAGKAGWRSSGIATSTTGYHIDNFHAK